jgi:antitoxin component YwqK of YwqJK toxin-antitoxin module
MLEKKYYANGTPVYKLTGDRLTYYYKNGKLKADGKYINDKMEGEWLFYRETGQLWEIGNFLDGMKHGSWTRYGRDDKVEKVQIFGKGKEIK